MHGMPGSPGAPGRDGRDGTKGDQGSTGKTGPQGPTGVVGKKGNKGDSGAQGRPGEKGERGEKGRDWNPRIAPAFLAHELERMHLEKGRHQRLRCDPGKSVFRAGVQCIKQSSITGLSHLNREPYNTLR